MSTGRSLWTPLAGITIATIEFWIFFASLGNSLTAIMLAVLGATRWAIIYPQGYAAVTSNLTSPGRCPPRGERCVRRKLSLSIFPHPRGSLCWITIRHKAIRCVHRVPCTRRRSMTGELHRDRAWAFLASFAHSECTQRPLSSMLRPVWCRILWRRCGRVNWHRDASQHGFCGA